MDMDDFPPFAGFLTSSESEDFPFGPPSPEDVSAEEEAELSRSTFKGDLEKVIELYETEPGVQCIVITSSEDTALHVAINDDREEVVERMVESILKYTNKKALKMKNNRGETPLHRAATRKSVTMCKCIVEAGRCMDLDLLSITNIWGETPVFTAALYNRKHAFFFLHRAAEEAYSQDREKPYQFLRRSAGAGDTALHAAIKREHFDLAFHMIKMCPDLVGKSNVKGMTPLHVLASKTSAFRSGLRLSWWKQIIYYCVHVDQLKYDPDCTLTSTISDKTSEDECPAPKNYLTCYQFFWGCYFGKIKDKRGSPGKSAGGRSEKEEGRDPEASNNSHINKNIPQNYTTCYEVLVSVYRNLFRFMGFEKIVNKIREEKEKHECSVQILKALIENQSTAFVVEGEDPGIRKVFDPREQNAPTNAQVHQKGNGGDSDKIESELLIAAKNGVAEIVKIILRDRPGAIYQTNSQGRNVLHVAVEFRQPHIFEILRKEKSWDVLIHSGDFDGNNTLHIVAKFKLQIQGSSALEMQDEIKWYEHVKSLLPSYLTVLTNKEGETPEETFLREHKDLVQKSDEWLSRTSESCSVVAALVAGVAYATSSTVPGGNDDKTGKPTLEGRPGFDIFAISALIALSFSVSALIMFLSILTSRKRPADFMKKLPVKLLLALSSLFVSIFSMFISFCAAHSFVLEDKPKTSVLPLYAIICLPVSFTIVEFPLYMDLFKGIFMKVQQPYDQRRI